MKRILTLALSCFSLLALAQSGSIKDPQTGKKVTYTVSGTQINYSNGKIAFPSITSTDFKLAYATATFPVIVTPPVTVPPVNVPDTYTLVGTGSGQLQLGTLANKNIKIKPGIYDYINVTKATNVKIDATGVILKGGSVDIDLANGLELWGLTVTDQAYRAMTIRGISNDVYLHDLTFKNIGNYTITYENAALYNGSDATLSKNWKLERLSFENTSTGFHVDGGFTDKGITGLMSNFKFLNSTIKNCPNIGNVIWMGAVEGYEIAGNRVDNVNLSFPDKNAPNGYHNGIFHMIGNGSFHDNVITNHQGNALRAWCASFNGIVKDVLIYNNVVWNSWKYGAFEIQATPEIQQYIINYPSRLTFANAKIYNNTAGHLNTSKDWEGQGVDVYNIGGTLEHYNNLYFDMVKVSGTITDGLDNMSDTKIVRDDGNRYFPTQVQAVTDTKLFKSLITGVGAQ
jgi:hypothetical protein